MGEYLSYGHRCIKQVQRLRESFNQDFTLCNLIELSSKIATRLWKSTFCGTWVTQLVVDRNFSLDMISLGSMMIASAICCTVDSTKFRSVVEVQAFSRCKSFWWRLTFTRSFLVFPTHPWSCLWETSYRIRKMGTYVQSKSSIALIFTFIAFTLLLMSSVPRRASTFKVLRTINGTFTIVWPRRALSLTMATIPSEFPSPPLTCTAGGADMVFSEPMVWEIVISC